MTKMATVQSISRTLFSNTEVRWLGSLLR